MLAQTPNKLIASFFPSQTLSAMRDKLPAENANSIIIYHSSFQNDVEECISRECGSITEERGGEWCRDWGREWGREGGGREHSKSCYE
jgi:hypothetical protein